MSPLSIGLFGGMFDPIHTGHLRAAKAALDWGLDKVLLLPCGTPAHRPAAQTAADDRLAMCSLAAKGIPGLEASGIDFREGPCYAADTVQLLKKEYPEARFYWLLGEDKVDGLSHWYHAEQLFSSCEFLICPRPGCTAAHAPEGAVLHRLNIEGMTDSSGMVKDRLRLLDDAPDLLPKSVAAYIAANGLYQPDYTPELLSRGMKPHRFAHTLGVRSTAVELAALHGENMQKAALAAILHDIAKPLPLEEMRALCAKYHADFSDELLSNGNLLHGPAAALIAQYELGITDPEVLSAIHCHTTGKPGMSRLDMIVFIADAIEPNREPYPGLENLRTLARSDLAAAVLASMHSTRDYVLSRGYPFCSVTESAMRSLTEKE